MNQLSTQDLLNFDYDGKKLKWRNNFEQLQIFVQDRLGINGKWSSPGGCAKRFKAKNGDFTVNWCCKKQSTLQIHGNEGTLFKNKLIEQLHKARPTIDHVKSNATVEEVEDAPAEEVEDEAGPKPVVDESIKEVTILSDISVETSQCVNTNGKSQTLCPCNCKAMSAEIEDIKLDIVILHNRVDTSNAKNTKSTEEISKLRLQLEKEKHMNRMLEDRAKTAEEERDSLRLALKLLMQDHVNKSLANDLSTQENCWQTAEKTTSNGKTSTVKTTLPSDGVNGEEAHSLWCHANRFSALVEPQVEPNQSHAETEESRPGANSTNKSKDDKCHNQAVKKRKTVIVGDSLVKGLNQYKLAKSSKQNVGVKCFAGATVGDMSDYIKPVLRRKPDNIVLHVGTNDTTSRKATEIMNDIDKLCQEIKEAAPETEIIISELVNREDNTKAKTTVNEVNKLLGDYCTATNLHLITHENITSSSLNRSNLHLNKYGSSIFARNIVNYLQRL